MVFLYISGFMFCLLLSLFMLYILVKNDFVLARKSLLLQEIFDVTFFSYVMFLIFGRIFYILASLQFSYFEPLKFFHLLKFPGINFLGGILGFYLVVFLFFSRKKILSRILDIFSLSLYPTFLFALAITSFKGLSLYFNILIFVLSLVFLSVSIYSYKNYTLKDGSIVILFISLSCVFTIISEFSKGSADIIFFFNIPQIISIFTFLICAGALLLREGLINSSKRNK